MAKKDIDLEFDFEDEFDFEPRADLDSDDTDEFDLSQFGIDDLAPELDQEAVGNEDYSDFDLDDLDLGEDDFAEEDAGLNFDGFDTAEESAPMDFDEEAESVSTVQSHEDFALEDDLREELDLDDDLDFDDDTDADEDEDLTSGIVFNRRKEFFQDSEEAEVAPVYEQDPPFRETEEAFAEEQVHSEEEVMQQETDLRQNSRRRRKPEQQAERPAKPPVKLSELPVLQNIVKLYFPSAEQINAAADPGPDANGRRRRRPSKQQIFKEFYLPTIIAGLTLVLMLSFVIGSLSNAIDRKREKDRLEQIQAEQESQQAQQQADEARNLLARAEELALGYNYDEAIALLSSYTGEPTQEMTAKKAELIDTKSRLVEHKDPSIIPNLSFHVLIHDMAKAMRDDDDLAGQYNRNFVSTSEFTKILEQLYRNGYVLVDYDSIVTNNGGTFFPNVVYLPEGKKPVMLTETMVNYFEYMVDGNKDGTPDADGDGFANRLIVDANGDIKAEWVDTNGMTQVGDFDLVPILETFIKAHPDFSYQGARATLAVTGSEGIFGYRINTSVISTKGTEYYDQQVAGATKIVAALKEKGYNIACYTFNNEDYFGKSAAQVKADLQLWNAQIAPIVGQLDTIVFARASDLGDYTGGKFDVVFDNGFRILVKNADEPYAEVNNTYVRQSRLMVTGNSLAWKSTQFANLFDANVVLDLATRGGNVPN